MLFANFAEAMAEGRGKAQADTLRKAKGETIAKRYTADNKLEDVPAPFCASETLSMWWPAVTLPATAR